MALIRKKLERLLSDISSGRITMAQGVLEQLQPELAQARYGADGRLDLESCSPRLRSIARAYYNTAAYLDHESSAEPAVAPTAAERLELADASKARELNRVLFAHWSEMFRSMTGCPPETFVPEGSSFGAEIRRLGERFRQNPQIAKQLWSEAGNAVEGLAAHYRTSANRRLQTAAALPGHKLVLGGAQNFSASSLRAVQSMLLYADSVLIPDPVHRWFEKDPITEGSPRVRMLEDIYYLTQLRPLVDADLPSSPLLVFPSWEKAMEEHDEQTQDGIESLVLAVLSEALDARFEDIEEIVIYVCKRPQDFDLCGRSDGPAPGRMRLHG